MGLSDAILYAPFLGWFYGLRPALEGEGFSPYSATWILTAPFLGWIFALWLLFQPWDRLLQIRENWP